MYRLPVAASVACTSCKYLYNRAAFASPVLCHVASCDNGKSTHANNANNHVTVTGLVGDESCDESSPAMVSSKGL